MVSEVSKEADKRIPLWPDLRAIRKLSVRLVDSGPDRLEEIWKWTGQPITPLASETVVIESMWAGGGRVALPR